jgi:hypothetical protein
VKTRVVILEWFVLILGDGVDVILMIARYDIGSTAGQLCPEGGVCRWELEKRGDSVAAGDGFEGGIELSNSAPFPRLLDETGVVDCVVRANKPANTAIAQLADLFCDPHLGRRDAGLKVTHCLRHNVIELRTADQLLEGPLDAKVAHLPQTSAATMNKIKCDPGLRLANPRPEHLAAMDLPHVQLHNAGLVRAIAEIALLALKVRYDDLLYIQSVSEARAEQQKKHTLKYCFMSLRLDQYVSGLTPHTKPRELAPP